MLDSHVDPSLDLEGSSLLSDKTVFDVIDAAAGLLSPVLSSSASISDISAISDI